MNQIERKIKEAKQAREYARAIGDAKLARSMTRRINSIISTIAYGA